ncbi:hypothetical protein [Prevotella nigrescens]
MPIRVFPPHYQLVYINFDISSFSLISYMLKAALLDCKNGSFAEQKDDDGARNIAYMRIKVFVLQCKRYGFVAQHYPVSLQEAMNKALMVAHK